MPALFYLLKAESEPSIRIVFAGQNAEIQEVCDKIWLVSFMQ